MSTIERLRSEAEFHDRQAQGRAAAWNDESLLLDDDAYLDHETWIRPGIDSLGDVANLNVLDLGCGHGMASVVLARRGARVVGLDLSLGYLGEARRRAAANGVTMAWLKANGERLPFADGAFDRVWGNAVLHHLDLEQAASELHRILAPSGRAVFCEPWGDNRLLEWARQSLPYPGKERTPDERPLRQADLEPLRRRFPRLRVEGFQLFAMVARVVGKGRVSSGLAWCDRLLLRGAPSLGRFCRYGMIVLEK